MSGRRRVVAHLSDLHFGRDRPELLEPLLDALCAAEPDLVAVSGDLTQRARHAQFRAARAFLDRLPAPALVVPGNHDTPLDHFALRLARPWSRWRRWIGPELAPRVDQPGLVAVGINTANPLDWQRGRFRKRDVAAAVRVFEKAGDAARIVVLHHPFVHAPHARKALMRGAARALDALAETGVDVALSGHLHSWSAAAHVAGRAREAGVLLVEAGTGLSTRGRGEPNDFNLLEIADDRITVTRFAAVEDGAGFRSVGWTPFRRGEAGWIAAV